MKDNTLPRVALCISGQPRSFVEAYPYIKKNLIDCNPNVDVFIHCWYNEQEVGHRFSHTSDTVREEGLNRVESNTSQRLMELYRPVTIVCEPQEDFSKKIKPAYMAARDKTNPFATFSMWTSIQRCNALKKEYEKKHSFTYKKVIKGRFDLCLQEPFTADPEQQQLITLAELPAGTVADILFVTTSRDMDEVAELVLHLDTYFNEMRRWNNESFLSRHLKQLGIKVEGCPNIKFRLARGERSYIDSLWYCARRLRNKLRSLQKKSLQKQ